MVITPWTKLHIWLRLMLLQASWNFERHQGLGFFYALLPGLKKLYSGQELLDVSRRYVGYFNTHPYLTPLVAGAVLKLEEDLARGNAPPVDVDDFKEIVAAPYAAIGDALFWGGMRPLAAGIGLFFAIKGLLWAPFVFLIAFNIVPFWFRGVFFLRGYREGLKSVEFIQENRLPDWAVHTKEAAIIVLGGLSAFMVYAHVNHQGITEWLGFLTIIPVTVFGYAARKGFSASLLILIVTLLILGFGLFWTDFVQWWSL